MRRRNGLMASSVMGMLLSDVRLATPHLRQDAPVPLRAGGTDEPHAAAPLPRERFSRVLGMLSSLEVKVLRPT